jgi:excisionase family DNA binding protein
MAFSVTLFCLRKFENSLSVYCKYPMSSLKLAMMRANSPDHSRPTDEDAMDTPLAYSIAEACTAARTGKTVLYEAIKLGTLRAVKRGRRTLVLPSDLRDWVERLPAIKAKGRDRRALQGGAAR